ncbi:cytochrome P450 [Aspergillus candidus]|uniref:Cytochrome P450 n=1 Tax=Aspergillus candidus TaxID=41067 RepID=A0A2I2F5A2_ASPCN|nr:cytochrome P450 [Aspergillus candidus]PLB35829.1 cytochrome P450 [Aspergillus candidus]
MSTATATAIVLLLLALLYLGYWTALPSPLPDIPYNAASSHRLLGDIPDMMKEVTKTGDIVSWLRDQNLKSKSVISQIFIRPMGKPILLVSDYEEARDVMVNRIKDFDRTSLTAETFGGLLNRQQFTLKTGPEWKFHRRLVQDTMTPAFLSKVAAPSIYASSRRFVELWSVKERLAAGRPFSATEDIFYSALDAVLAFSFGPTFPQNATDPQTNRLKDLLASELRSDEDAADADEAVHFPHAKIDEAIESMLELGDAMEQVKSAPSPRMKWWYVKATPTFKRWARIKDACIRREIEKAVEARGQHQRSSEGLAWERSAVDRIVDKEESQARREGRKPDFFSAAVMEEVFGFIVAGHDTMSTTLCWGVKLLADHADSQSQLRRDLFAAFGSAVAEKRAPTVEEIMQTSVPLLDATMEEILRCGGTVPIGDREAIRDTTLLGHRIPKGTLVFFLHNSHSMLLPALDVDDSRRSPRSLEAKERGQTRCWGDEDIAQFRPGRWLVPKGQDDSDDTSLVFDANAGPNIPFGLGVRACFGRRLAYVEFRIMLIMMIWHFEFLKCPEAMSGYAGCLAVVNKPRQCFVRLRKVDI